jgi:hypothetical protein
MSIRFNLSDDPPEVIMDELRRAGWSLGDAKFGDTWTVSGTNGENVILAHSKSIEEAWRRAAEQARSFGTGRPSNAPNSLN